jgi:hypothetical protein
VRQEVTHYSPTLFGVAQIVKENDAGETGAQRRKDAKQNEAE